jgi:predicted ArsR family transcriptional regulator
MPRTQSKLGYRKRDTEKLAALSLPLDYLKSIKGRVAMVYIDNPGGLTVDEAAELMGEEHYTVRRRVSDLVADGFLVDAGERRQLESGRQGAVWTLANKQMELLAA